MFSHVYEIIFAYPIACLSHFDFIDILVMKKKGGKLVCSHVCLCATETGITAMTYAVCRMPNIKVMCSKRMYFLSSFMLFLLFFRMAFNIQYILCIHTVIFLTDTLISVKSSNILDVRLQFN